MRIRARLSPHLFTAHSVHFIGRLEKEEEEETTASILMQHNNKFESFFFLRLDLRPAEFALGREAAYIKVVKDVWILFLFSDHILYRRLQFWNRTSTCHSKEMGTLFYIATTLERVVL